MPGSRTADGRLRIGLDCQALEAGVRHGFSTYLGNLLRALRDRFPEHEFLGWSCRHGAGWRIPNQLWWDQVRVPWRAWRGRVDLLHVPAFSGALVRTCPLVLTVHDLMYVRHPEWLPTGRAGWYWGPWIARTARHATAVIVPSEATKRDLVDLGRVAPDRITVVPEAVDPHFLKIPAAAEVDAYRRRLGLDKPYILYVGVIDRRKDLSGLVRAYAQLRSRVKDHRLVIAGHLIEGRSTLREEIDALGLGEHVRLPGYVDDTELPLLYAGASLFVYPSHLEGFGLPPLEAMAQGVPVVVYRNSSLPEVVGDAAILIDPPYPVEALAEAMFKALEHDAFRQALVAAGHRRIGQFSWRRTAEETMAVYRRCLA